MATPVPEKKQKVEPADKVFVKKIVFLSILGGI